MRKGKLSTLSGMVDTDMEENTVNADALPTPDSNQENTGAPKKRGPRAKASAKRFTKPKRLSGGSITTNSTSAPKSKAGKKRAPLKEQAGNKIAEDKEKLDDFVSPTDSEEPTEVPIKPKATNKRKAGEIKRDRPVKTRTVERVGAVKDGEFEYTPTAIRQSALEKKIIGAKFNVTQRQTSAEHRKESIIPETQASPNVGRLVAQEKPLGEDEEMPHSVLRRSLYPHPTSRQRQLSVTRRRAGSASDTERVAGDPTLRQKLGELTRKFETVDRRYRDLITIRVTEAEANYERLKKQSEIKAKGGLNLRLVSLFVLKDHSCKRSYRFSEKRDRNPEIHCRRVADV